VGKFWESLGGKLADRWVTVSVPALIFWLGGVLAWALDHGGWAAFKRPNDWVGRQPGVVQAILLVVALLAVAASGVLVDRFTGRALALLEGYWPAPLGPLRRWLVARADTRMTADESAFARLAGLVHDGTATPQQRGQYVRIDQRNRRRPPARARLMPTRIGNVLRAAETRPIDKYGLDAVALWPHLWLLLPETTRTELAAARRSLDSAVAAVLWGLLFVAFTPWTWWAAPVAVVVTAAAIYLWVPPRAEVFADLIEAAFDLHRTALYTQLRWPLPANPAEERQSGRRMTTYLARGLTGTNPTFTTPSP
jgi:hypothetical protein